MVFLKNALMCNEKKVKLINHDCLPILMLLYIMLYIVLAYLMLFAALTNSVCLNNASLFSFFLYNIFYKRAMSSPGKYHLKITIIIIIIIITMPLLNRPAHSKATLGDRSFSFASSSVWNSIPNDVRCAPSLSSFKSRLKTYLFRSVYID